MGTILVLLNNSLGINMATTKTQIFDILDNNKQAIIEKYTADHLSINELGDWCNKEYKLSMVSHYGSRGVASFLRQCGVYEGAKRVNPRKTEKSIATNLKKYGVINAGQLETNGYKRINKIPYKKLNGLGDAFKTYKLAVEKLTNTNIKYKDLVNYCEYTGVEFADVALCGVVNPNDPAKRTVDHRVPVLIGYLNGISAEKIAEVDNLAYVIRYVNSAKGNTLYESFIPVALKIKEIFENEGYTIKET